MFCLRKHGILGTENVGKESMMSISALADYCLFQNLSLNSNGHSSVLVFGSLRKTETKANKYNGSSTNLSSPGLFVHVTAEMACVPSNLA